MPNTEVKLEKATNLLYFIIWAFVNLLVLPGAIALLTNWVLPWVDPSLDALSVQIATIIYVVSALGFFPFLRTQFPNYTEKMMRSETEHFKFAWGFWILSWFGIAIIIQGLTLILLSSNFYVVISIISFIISFYYISIFKRLDVCRESEKRLCIGIFIIAAFVELILVGIGVDFRFLVLLKIFGSVIIFAMSYIPQIQAFISKLEENFSRMFSTLILISILNTTGILLLVHIGSVMGDQNVPVFVLWSTILIGIVVLLKINLLLIIPFLYGVEINANRPSGIVRLNTIIYLIFVVFIAGLGLFSIYLLLYT